MTTILRMIPSGKPRNNRMAVSVAINVLEVSILPFLFGSVLSARQVGPPSVVESKPPRRHLQQPFDKLTGSAGSGDVQLSHIIHQKDGKVKFSEGSFFQNATRAHFGIKVPPSLGASLQLDPQESSACEDVIKNALEICIRFERNYLDSNQTNIIPPQPLLYREVSEVIRTGLGSIVDSERADVVSEFYLSSPLFAPLLLKRELGAIEWVHAPTNTMEVVGAVQLKLEGTDGKAGWRKTVNAQDNPDLFKIRYLPLIDWSTFLDQ